MEYVDSKAFAKAVQDNMKDNPDYTAGEIVIAMGERGDTIGGMDVSSLIEKNTDFRNNLNNFIDKLDSGGDYTNLDDSILNFEEDEPEVEITDANSIIASKGGTPIEKEELGDVNNYQALENLYDRYRQIYLQKKNLIDEYNGGKGLPSGSDKKNEYEKKLKIFNDELNNIENGEELYNIVKSIKEDGLGTDKYGADPENNGILRSNANMYLGTMMNKKFSNDNEGKGFMGTILGNENLLNIKEKGLDFQSLDDKVDKYLGQYTSGGENEHGTSEGGNRIDTNQDGMNKKKLQIVSDKSSFGEDVSGKGGNEYLDRRNRLLISQLEKNGITSKEEIDAYLNQYPSWKNAKQEWKDNTLNKLSEGIKEKQATKKEDTKETPKEPTNKNEGKKFNIVREGIKNRINFETSNDSPLNGEEEEWNEFWNEESKKEDNNSLRAKQYKEKGYTVKNGKFYTPSGVLVESNGNNLSETGEWIPAKSSKSDTKNNKTTTKRQEVKNTLKSSPTITGLLKSKKK